MWPAQPSSHPKSPKPYAKADIKAYPVLKHIEKYSRWYDSALATARAHGIEDVFDPAYTPDVNNYNENLEFWYKQTFFYAVLCQTIKPSELTQYVEQQIGTSDAQKVLSDMNRHIRQSTYAVITTADMMKEITTTVFDVRSWDKTILEWILGFDKLMMEYNKLQRNPTMRLNDIMKRTYMQQALRESKGFQDISDREHERMVTGDDPYTYPQYLTLLKSKAARLDAAKKNKKIREIKTHDIGRHPDEGRGTNDLEINVAKTGDNVPGSRMPLTTWKSLSDETQSIWDQIDPAEKVKILAAARDDTRKMKRKVNFTDQTTTNETIEANVHSTNDEDDDASDPGERQTFRVNTALSTARKEAHPGDPRRMMGTDNPSRTTITTYNDDIVIRSKDETVKSHLKAMIHSFIDSDEESDDGSSEDDEDFSSYWNDLDFR